ncbi:ABC transporter ATP-binding protein [Sulfurivermis fontis]|uniref:ABC transporter ATP-binding protein n=1 Tax=Sulfurivermis fontis TaxID=1972068 RepID=UPI000FDAE389|nr:ABC transporter ATP-binding protein [Sulfurivermis fontis]
MIRLNDISKAFNQGRPNEFWAVRNVSLDIEDNRITVLRGPSGSGKTTLLSMIGCLSRPTSGRILLGERNLSGLPERFLTQIRRETFGFIFQRFNLIQGLTVLDNVMLPAYPLAPDHGELVQRATTLLDQFGMAGKRDAKVEWLSGGEAQRTAICRALLNDPQVIIADEPTANLDTRLSQEFMHIIAELKAAGRTLILTSHDPVVSDAGCVDRVITLRDGQVQDH